jgi:MGT family glycosyltransferase
MSRFLIVTLPLAGHVNPPAAVARVLEERGHDVAWSGSEARLRPWLGPDARVYPTGMRLFRGQADNGIASVKSLWEGFIVPFTRFTLPAVEKAIADFRPDVVVTDQHALAGALAAERHGMPWATLCTSTIELGRPFEKLPKVDEWIRGHLATLTAEAGLANQTPLAGGQENDLRFSPYLVIVFSSEFLLGDQAFPGHFALVGPALSARPPTATAGFPWDRLDPDRRHVLVTVGTMADADAMDFYPRAVDALRPLGDSVQGIVVAPPEAIHEAMRDVPEHIMPMARIPQLELLPRTDAVVCHGGLNTVSETLSNAVPLVVAPLTRDQPINAANVVRVGAGIRVNFHRVRPVQLRDAVLALLSDPSYRAAAGRVRDSFTAAGGAAEAAARLERLAANPVPAKSGG